MMFEYWPRAAHGDPPREAASPQASIDRLENYTNGSFRKPRISPSGNMTRAWNDYKPRVLTDLPTSSMGVAILATKAIIVTTHPNEGPKSLSMTHEQ
jgi:hypothetical protein